MPRYSANPTNDTAGFPIFPKGDYRFKTGEPKTFAGETKEGDNKGKQNWGVHFLCKSIPGPVDAEGHETPAEWVGKPAMQKMFYHSDDAASFRKQFQLAVFGFSVNEEDQFNANMKGILEQKPEFWDYDTDTGFVGEGFKLMGNREFVMSLDTEIDKKTNKPRQKTVQVRPIPTPQTTADDVIVTEEEGGEAKDEVPFEVISEGGVQV